MLVELLFHPELQSPIFLRLLVDVVEGCAGDAHHSGEGGFVLALA
jgi:hypothetical protein